MLRPRIIPVLLIQDKGLVKTCGFKNPTYLGDPINAIKIFNEKEVDELVILDIKASHRTAGIDWSTLGRFNREAFMPMAYGGGIKNLTDMKKVINFGYEKVIINSVILDNLNLVKEASEVIGSQSLVVCVDVKKNRGGLFRVYNHLKKEITEIDPVEYIKLLEEAGVGEIIVQSVDREGTYTGYELSLLNDLAKMIKIPLIALGGASGYQDIKQILKTDVSAAAAASIFVFYGRLKAVLITYPSQSEIENIIL